MDGFASTNDRPVFVIAANYFADAPGLHGNRIYLSLALLRRFNKKVYVDLSCKDERVQFLKMKKAMKSMADMCFASGSSRDYIVILLSLISYAPIIPQDMEIGS